MAETIFFLTETMMDRSEVQPESMDSSQEKNIAAHVDVPRDCHLFLRPRPGDDELELPINLHRHYVLFYCLAGRGCVAVDGAPYVLAADEAILVAPGQPHSRLPLDGERPQWLVIRFSMSSDPEWLTLMQNLVFRFDPERRRLLDELRRACGRRQTMPEEDSAAAECLLRLALLLNSLRTAEGRQIRTQPELPPAVRRLCRLLVTAGGENRTFTEIAKEQGISAGHLRMLFKRATGKTPTRARSDERRRRAVHLITHTELNMSEIAARLGFGSIYAFSRFFKRCMGISPLRFRMQERKKR